MKKKLFILAAAMTLALSWSITASAQPEVMPDGVVFDAEYYAQSNPDVVAVFGTDANMLYLHYTRYGKAEGREAVSPNTDIALTTQSADEFDAAFHAAAYPDVAAALGNTQLNHCPYPLNVVLTETSRDGLTNAVLYTTISCENINVALRSGISIENSGFLTDYDVQLTSAYDRLIGNEIYNLLRSYGLSSVRYHYLETFGVKVGTYAEGTVYKYTKGVHVHSNTVCPNNRIGCKPGTITLNLN